MDRILGLICAALTLACAAMVFAFFSWSWPWMVLVIWTIILGSWTYSGTTKEVIPVGFKGQLLLMDTRMDFIFDEGKRWCPYPFGIKPVDYRYTTIKLDPVKVFCAEGKAEVIVKDMSVIFRILDSDLYNNLNPQNLKTLLDDIVDNNVRKKIRTVSIERAVVMSLGTKEVETSHDLSTFGIKVTLLLVPQIAPADPGMLKDIQLRQAEEFQRKGQLIEAEHIIMLTNLFQKPVRDGGANLSPSDAKELAELITGKANAKNISGFTFPPEILEAILKILGGKP